MRPAWNLRIHFEQPTNPGCRAEDLGGPGSS